MVCGQRGIELWIIHKNFICNWRLKTHVILGVVVSGIPRNHNHHSPSTRDSVWVNRNNWSSHLPLRPCTVISVKHGQEKLEVETRDYRPPHQGYILWVLVLWFMPRQVTCIAVSCFILTTLHDSKPRLVSDARKLNYKTWRTHGGEHSYCGLVSPCSLVGGSKLFSEEHTASVFRVENWGNIFLETNSCILLPIYKASHIPDIILIITAVSNSDLIRFCILQS